MEEDENIAQISNTITLTIKRGHSIMITMYIPYRDDRGPKWKREEVRETAEEEQKNSKPQTPHKFTNSAFS